MTLQDHVIERLSSVGGVLNYLKPMTDKPRTYAFEQPPNGPPADEPHTVPIGALPAIREVRRPEVPKKAALIQIGACGACTTDLHILKGHWAKPLPWPFTLGHELGGVTVECGGELTEDFMSRPLGVGSKSPPRHDSAPTLSLENLCLPQEIMLCASL